MPAPIPHPSTSPSTSSPTPLFPSNVSSPLSLLSPSSSSCPTLLNARTNGKRDFSWSYTDEPHFSRRREILAAHPEIRHLFGVEPLTFPIVVSIFVVQLLVASLLSSSPWYIILPLAYLLGGTLNHSLQLAVHELSHNLCFEAPLLNKLAAIFANLATGFPSSVSFQKYHMDHHQWQGVDGVDTDIPTPTEVSVFVNSLLKVAWIVLQPVFYAVRPTIVKPKPYGKWELINITVQVAFNVAIAYLLGFKALSYLIVSTLLGLGLHPAAGHFIAEHYELVSGQETYSYYGAFNYVNFNVGYHNEHHDFPRVPWSRLPEVTRLAPEFYLTLPHYTSYLALFWAYVTDGSLGPHARIKRGIKEGKEHGGQEVRGKGGEDEGKGKGKKRWEGLSFVLIAIGWFSLAIGYVVYNVVVE